MSDFFDNEPELEEVTEETEEKKIQKKNGVLKIAVYAFCVAIIVCGCFFAKEFIPKKEKKNTSTPSSSSEEEIKVLDLDTSKLKSITVNNPKGTLNIYSETANESTSWYVDGVNKELISTYSTSLLATAATNITASREITEMTDADCGFDAPSFRTEILGSDDSKISFMIGKDAAIGDGCYLKIDGKSEIYLVDNTIKTSLNKEAIDLADADSMPRVTETDSTKAFFENGELYSCDSITVTGKNYPKPLVIVQNDDQQIAEYVKYKITSPDDHLADNIDDLFALFANGVTTDGAYSFDAADPAGFGLNDPDITVTMKLNDKTSVFKFAKRDDGYYAGWCSDGKVIYRVALSTIESVVKSKATDYYSKLVCLYYIDDLTSFAVKTSDKTYSFGIAANSDTKSEDKYVITHDGKKVDCKSFQNFYQFVISTPCEEYGTTNASGDKISFEFAFKNGGKDSIEFIRISDTRYQYSINGKAMGQVSATRLNKIVKYSGQLVN
ncbi:MAG: DUF4340 domain-containing protein, partial [Clostridia bacterium]|nr:DUF4340 domain-containing protein [Clostridia bacterium]